MSFSMDGDLSVLFGRAIKFKNSSGTDVTSRLEVASDETVRLTRPMRRSFFDFTRMGDPICCKARGAGASTGTAGDINQICWPEHGLSLNYVIKGTQTLVAPIMTTVGLDIGSMDQTADDGLEIRPSVLSKHDLRFVIGTSPAFRLRAKVKVEDVSGTDDLCIGFRKQEADQANVDDYADGAWIQLKSGDIFTETIVGGAATTSTDTTQNWADGETHTVEVVVSAAGVVTFKIDNAPPTVTQAFTFTDALAVIPFIFFLQDTDIAGKVELIELECGPV